MKKMIMFVCVLFLALNSALAGSKSKIKAKSQPDIDVSLPFEEKLGDLVVTVRVIYEGRGENEKKSMEISFQDAESADEFGELVLHREGSKAAGYRWVCFSKRIDQIVPIEPEMQALIKHVEDVAGNLQ